jgi:hypothetical protein
MHVYNIDPLSVLGIYPAGNPSDYVLFPFYKPQRHGGHKEREDKETCGVNVLVGGIKIKAP